MLKKLSKNTSNSAFKWYIFMFCCYLLFCYQIILLLAEKWVTTPTYLQVWISTVVHTYFPLYDCSLLLQSVHEQFLRTMWLYFLPFSLDLTLAEYINRKIRRLRRGCQENIRILNLTAFVVSKNLPTMKSVRG